MKTFVVPRSVNTQLTRFAFRGTKAFFEFYIWLRRFEKYEDRDRVLAIYAPFALMVLVLLWFMLVSVGYAGIFFGLGIHPWQKAFILSGSSLLTLGFATPPDNVLHYAIIFSEATIGLGLMALLIAYLPTMYNAFSKREREVTLLEVRAGMPPSAITMIERFHRINNIETMSDMWADWEIWFSEIEESHTSLGPLVFFRSPKPGQSWVITAGTILDAASLYHSTLDVPRDARTALCLRAGFFALRAIADFFNVPYDSDPAPDDLITISQSEFDEAYDRLAAHGIPLKPDREQAWRDFAGWCVNYDVPLVALAKLTEAPIALWSSDRSLILSAPKRRRWFWQRQK